MTGWLDVMKLAHPKHMVFAEDVKTGKPDPACYLLGKNRLGLKSTDSVLVVEDAPAGISAGSRAGCKVIGLATTHSLEQIRQAGADWIVRDLRSVRLVGHDGSGGVQIEIRDALESSSHAL